MPISLPLSKDSVLAVGLMSGTSLDGIDAALVRIVGAGYNTKVTLLAFDTLFFDNQLKEDVFNICRPETSSVDLICRLNVVLAEKMAEAVYKVVEQSHYRIDDLDFISSHGQTIFHMPAERATLQIGELAVIAHQTNTLTVGDFRPSDLAVGGQGAPLVPFVDQLLFRSTKTGRVLVNIGGMANITILPRITDNTKNDHDVFAFDTGPGNVLIDEIVRIGTNGKADFDKGGMFALNGNVNKAWLNRLIAQDPFLSRPYPKSTGREYYHREMADLLWQDGKKRNLCFEDIVATITSVTVESIVLAIDKQVDPTVQIDELFVGGGGVHNRFIMNQLQEQTKRPVSSMESLGFSSDAKEAVAFAILGNEFLRQQPNNTPSATGAKKAVSMGKLALPY
ncbi:anhydro-N-acetylmuramic acid kinase [Shouchella patagoniensis]|uniref:anhydro-N-acetylmuramic acid kinase n=1 Tax=Shouchella patagoniensis TaxID=228576 RepID=UPI001FE373A0|nr:anhydro-N-acetylmuramic acid kinase [Shouchella patagoniensis]